MLFKHKYLANIHLWPVRLFSSACAAAGLSAEAWGLWACMPASWTCRRQCWLCSLWRAWRWRAPLARWSPCSSSLGWPWLWTSCKWTRCSSLRWRLAWPPEGLCWSWYGTESLLWPLCRWRGRCCCCWCCCWCCCCCCCCCAYASSEQEQLLVEVDVGGVFEQRCQSLLWQYLLVDAAHTWLLLSHAVLPGSDYISDFEKKQSLQRKLVGCVEWCAHFVNLEIFPKRKFLNPKKTL